MGLLSGLRTLLAARRTQPNPEFSGERVIWLPSKHLGGIRMTPDDALQLSAVWACVTVISKALASCDWEVFLERDNGDRIPRRQLTTYRLLNDSPNTETGAFNFMEAMYIQALVWGNFYAEIEKDRGGRPVALWPLAPERCTLERESDNRLVLVVRNRADGETVLDYSEEVFHVHGPGVDGLSGFDTVTMAARTLAHSAAAERFGQSFYHNNTQLGGMLSFDQNLNKETRTSVKEAIEGGHKGSDKAWGLLVLDNGPKYHSFGTEPEKAQFIETRFLLIEEVCRIFGVPPHKVAHLLRATFSNIEEQSIEFVRDALTPWAERAAQEVNRKLLRPWPAIRARLDLDWAAEGNAKSKAETDSILVQNGIINRNEARKRRGFNTIGPDGDKYTVQVNMTTLEKIGTDAPVAEPADDAAFALFRMAALKAQRRRAIKAEPLEDRAEILAADGERHGRYVGTLITDVLKTLKVKADNVILAGALKTWLDEETALLIAGESFDPESRADEIAKTLTTLIRR